MNDYEKNPKPSKKIKSKTPLPYEYFKATEIMPGEGPMVQPEIIREQLIRMMTNMDQKGIEKMADYIVCKQVLADFLTCL